MVPPSLCPTRIGARTERASSTPARPERSSRCRYCPLSLPSWSEAAESVTIKDHRPQTGRLGQRARKITPLADASQAFVEEDQGRRVRDLAALRQNGHDPQIVPVSPH